MDDFFLHSDEIKRQRDRLVQIRNKLHEIAGKLIREKDNLAGIIKRLNELREQYPDPSFRLDPTVGIYQQLEKERNDLKKILLLQIIFGKLILELYEFSDIFYKFFKDKTAEFGKANENDDRTIKERDYAVKMLVDNLLGFFSNLLYNCREIEDMLKVGDHNGGSLNRLKQQISLLSEHYKQLKLTADWEKMEELNEKLIIELIQHEVTLYHLLLKPLDTVLHLIDRLIYLIDSYKNKSTLQYSEPYIEFVKPTIDYKGLPMLHHSIAPFWSSQFMSHYKFGVPIAPSKYASDEGDTLKGKQVRILLNYFRSIIQPENKMAPDEKRRLLQKVVPVRNMRNLMFHQTPADRVPIIAKVGLLSRSLTDRFTKKYFLGYTIQGSGWGIPMVPKSLLGKYVNNDKILTLVDVHDPASLKLFNENRDFYKSIQAKGKGIFTSNDIDVKFKIDPNYNVVNIYGGNHTFTTGIYSICFVIMLKNFDIQRVLRYSAGLAYVKLRIDVDEIIGLVINEEGLTHFNSLLEYLIGKIPLGKNYWELLEILGNTVKRPIYDAEFNLVWPEYIPHEQLLQIGLRSQS